MAKYLVEITVECKTLYNTNSQCKAFDYGVSPHRNNCGYSTCDCQIHSSADRVGCIATDHNLDLCTKPYPSQPLHTTTMSAIATTTPDAEISASGII